MGELIEKGVAERKARQLALDVPDQQPVSDQIEYAEHLIAQDRRGRAKISNPAGFLIWAVESNLSVPADFETSRKKQIRAAQEQAEGEERFRVLQLQNQYEQFCLEETDKCIRSYDKDDFEVALREQMKIVKREQPEWFGRIPEATQREVALARLRSTIRESLELPTFEHWSKSDLQQRLF